jgi:DNA polymerase-3 subunit gamma/tau
MGALSKIVENEGFQVEPAALQIITATSGGSMRDALSLLDQALSFGTGKVTAEDMQNLLGFLPKDIINATVTALAAEDMAELLSRVKEVTEQGYNLLQFARDLRDHLRYVLLNKVNPAILEIPDEEKTLLESQKELFSVAWLTRSGHLLSKALDEMRWSDQPRLVLELYLLKLAQPFAGVKELMARLEKLEKNLPAGDREPAQSAPARSRMAAQKPAAAVEFDNTPAPESAGVELDEPLPEFSEAASAPAPVAGGDPGIAAVWAGIVREVQGARPIIGSMLAGVGLKGLSGGNVTVAVTNTFQQEGLKRNQAYIEEMLTKKLGKTIGLKIVIEEKSSSTVDEKEEIVVDEEMPPPVNQPVYQVEGSLNESGSNVPPGLEKIMNKFPGRVTKKKN